MKLKLVLKNIFQFTLLVPALFSLLQVHAQTDSTATDSALLKQVANRCWQKKRLCRFRNNHGRAFQRILILACFGFQNILHKQGQKKF